MSAIIESGDTKPYYTYHAWIEVNYPNLKSTYKKELKLSNGFGEMQKYYDEMNNIINSRDFLLQVKQFNSNITNIIDYGTIIQTEAVRKPKNGVKIRRQIKIISLSPLSTDELDNIHKNTFNYTNLNCHITRPFIQR